MVRLRVLVRGGLCCDDSTTTLRGKGNLMAEKLSPRVGVVGELLPTGFGQKRRDLRLNVKKAKATAGFREVTSRRLGIETPTVWGVFLRPL